MSHHRTLAIAQDVGTGPLVVLINGAGSPLAHLEGLAERLATRQRVVVPAFPGYGGHAPYDGAYDGVTDRALLDNLLARIGEGSVHAVVGVSFGAHRALDLAARQPAGRIARVVGISPVVVMSDADRDGLRAAAGAARARSLPVPALVERNLSPRYRARVGVAAAEATMSAWISAVHPEAFGAELEVVASATKAEAFASQVRARVTLVTGTEDPVAAFEHVHALARMLPGPCEIKEIAGAGHMLFEEEFERTAAAIEAALAAPA